MRLLVVLLLCEVLLHLANVEQLGRCFVSCGEPRLHLLPILLQQFCVAFLQRQQLALVILARLSQLVVPVFVEGLVLLDVGRFALLPLLLVHEVEFFHGAGELLLF